MWKVILMFCYIYIATRFEMKSSASFEYPQFFAPESSCEQFRELDRGGWNFNLVSVHNLVLCIIVLYVVCTHKYIYTGKVLILSICTFQGTGKLPRHILFYVRIWPLLNINQERR